MSRILRHVGNKDFKRTRQRQIGEQKERAAQKLKEWQEAEAERKQIEEIARPLKSDWREETQLQESDWTPVAGSIANSSAQTFEYPGGSRVTVSGLGGVEAMPSSVSVTQFGDTFNVDPPNYSQLGLQGYAKPLGFGVQRRRDYEDVNPRLDASQEFARTVKSDVFMNARVEQSAIEYQNKLDAYYKAVDVINNKYVKLNSELYNYILDKAGAPTLPGGFRPSPILMPDLQQELDDKRDKLDAAKQREYDALTHPNDAPIYDPYFQRTYPDEPTPTDVELEKKSKQEAELNAKSDALTKQMEDLYSKLEELPDKGRPIRYEVIEPGDPDYTDTTDMANAIGYNRRPIYSAAANAIQAKIEALMNQQTAIFAQLNALSGAGPETPAPEQGPDPYSIKDPVVAQKDEDDFIDAIADKMGVGTAKDVFDYFSKWNKNKTKDPRPQDLTNLLSPNDKAALQDLVDRSMDGRTDEFGAMGVNNELQNIINGNPGLRNSIGTLDRDAGDGAYVQGDNIVINKAYDFSNALDILGAGGLAVGLGALGYGIGSRTFSPSDLISGTDTMNMQIKIPIRRKKKVNESTWSRLQKHRFKSRRRDLENLNETMTSSGMGMINYSAMGDVDLGTAYPNFTLSGPSGHGYNSVTRNMQGDRSSFDTIVVKVNSNSSDWEIVHGDNFTVYGSGGVGSKTVLVPSISSIYYTAKDDGSISFETTYQRRAPVNVFVSLDDPEANAFMRGHLGGDKERRKRFKNQLDASKEWMDYLGLEGSKTSPGDIELASADALNTAGGVQGTNKDYTYDTHMKTWVPNISDVERRAAGRQSKFRIDNPLK